MGGIRPAPPSHPCHGWMSTVGAHSLAGLVSRQIPPPSTHLVGVWEPGEDEARAYADRVPAASNAIAR